MARVSRRASEKTVRILLLDDDPLVRRAVLRLLGSRGHEIVEVGSALHAVEVASKTHFDLALLDWELGGTMTGLDVAAEIRKLQREQTSGKTALVLITGHTTEEMRAGWRDPLSGLFAIVGKTRLSSELAYVVDQVEHAGEDTNPGVKT
jgi:CheY-like chemotaxis protein